MELELESSHWNDKCQTTLPHSRWVDMVSTYRVWLAERKGNFASPRGEDKQSTNRLCFVLDMADLEK